MATLLPDYPVAHADTAKPRRIRQVRERPDLIFRGLTRTGGIIVLLIMVLVAVFLSTQAVTAISSEGLWAFLTTQEWSPETNHFGIAAVLTGTILIALVALIVAIPLALGMALFITEIATGGLRRTLQSTVDLMAAVPSVIYGLWGLYFFEQAIVPFAVWLNQWFGWIPIFAVSGTDPDNPLPNDALFKSSTLIAGLVVALMIVPVMTAMMSESFSRAPIGEREAAYALGATRWGMIRAVVLPFGKGGIIGGTMLGLGRALGETIAIYLIISPLYQISFQILHKGASSVAALIATKYGEANPFTMSALMAAGLALFIVTMIINFTASTVIARSRSGAESEA
ncbi:phosphate ABC transporter permease subunit PstC [Subtercola sp. RTI3]|uniref:phosphate ABC transporter permease subunit PstC n=1 Tax=Subtercola sp. RTI3 TaxID=3048639 RepID=UPI002B22CF3C|nr:phosphate ABC transporter permease subunit PstC [Subtercola sp. RTI3]MEA9986805.1 phosphate ABC transporter permease subunit PstC [Subtercola sp. RTI3]